MMRGCLIFRTIIFSTMPARSKSAPFSPDAGESTFEQSLEELEAIIQALDGGPQGLDELVTKYERGMGLLARCQQQLDTAQLRIEEITLRADGSIESAPFPAEAPPASRTAPAVSRSFSDAQPDEIRLF